MRKFRSFSMITRIAACTCILATFACGRFYLSDGVSRSPAVATSTDGFSSGFGPPPSTATVWVEQISPDALAVVGKAFHGFGSDLADAAPVRTISDPVPVAGRDPLDDPTSGIAGLAVVRINGGFFVVWMELNGPIRARFTDLSLTPTAPAFTILDFVGEPLRSQGRFKLWTFFVESRDRIVVFWDISATSISYAVIDALGGAVLDGVQVLPERAPYADVSYAPDSQRTAPFMLTYLLPEGDLDDPFTVYAALLSFDVDARSLVVNCRTDVSGRSTNNFNNVAGAAHPEGNRFVVYDERNGDLFGRFITENCSRAPEIPLGTRRIVSDTGQVPRREFLPLDVEFESSGAGLVALKQAVPNNSVDGGRVFIVSVVPLVCRFSPCRIVAGPLDPVGVSMRDGVPYTNRSFQLSWGFVDDVFKLVFDEAAIDAPSTLAIPSTWRVLFDALDASGSTVDPSSTASVAAADSTFEAEFQSQGFAVGSGNPWRELLPRKTLKELREELGPDSIGELRKRLRSVVPELDFEALLKDAPDSSVFQ